MSWRSLNTSPIRIPIVRSSLFIAGVAARILHAGLLVLMAVILGTAANYAGFLTDETPIWLSVVLDAVPVLSLEDYIMFQSLSVGIIVALGTSLILSPTLRYVLGLAGARLPAQIVRSIYLLAFFFVTIALMAGLMVVGQQAPSPSLLLLLLQVHLWASVAGLVAMLLALLLSLAAGRWSVSAVSGANQRRRVSILKSLVLPAGLGIIAVVTSHHVVTQPIELTCANFQGGVEIDGVAHPVEWSRSDSTRLTLWGGHHFFGGATQALVRVNRTGQRINVLVQWRDRTRSLNRYLIKIGPYRWVELAPGSAHELDPQSEYWEDKLLLAFSGISTISQLQERGDTFSVQTGDTVDIWVWASVSTNPTGQADDRWLGPDSTGAVALHPDPRTGGGAVSNFNDEWQQPYLINWGPQPPPWIEVDSRFVSPYWPAEDTLAIGSLIPSVITGKMMGDGADVQAVGRHFDGMWTVEFSRPVSTGSPFDHPLDTVFTLDLAISDNSRTGLSRSLKPVEVTIPQ
ncbi:hypothetical protein GF356_05560 [candidate division GN15 bacterium]|nr:hypothetical protein [candidate division GN15 bacterium]